MLGLQQISRNLKLRQNTKNTPKLSLTQKTEISTIGKIKVAAKRRTDHD